MGVPLDLLTLDETVAEVHRVVEQRTPVQHCVLNAFKIHLLSRNPKLKAILEKCGIVQADGISVVWAGRLLGLPPVPRVTGIDLMERLFPEAEKKGYRLFFFGAEPHVLARAVAEARKRYPGLQISGEQHGFFNSTENDRIAQTIAASKTDILLVALPSPAKEFWLAENLNRINVPFAMGVGGSFDILAGKTRRAPLSIQRMGFEWLYRILQEPVRLAPRYAECVSHFGWLLMKELFRKRRSNQ